MSSAEQRRLNLDVDTGSIARTTRTRRTRVYVPLDYDARTLERAEPLHCPTQLAMSPRIQRCDFRASSLP